MFQALSLGELRSKKEKKKGKKKRCEKKKVWAKELVVEVVKMRLKSNKEDVRKTRSAIVWSFTILRTILVMLLCSSSLDFVFSILIISCNPLPSAPLQPWKRPFDLRIVWFWYWDLVDKQAYGGMFLWDQLSEIDKFATNMSETGVHICEAKL